MKKLMFLSLLLFAAPLLAQDRIDLLFDVEGARPASTVKSIAPGVQFIPRFDTGGGLGVGVNWFFGNRVSLETKIAGIGSRMHLRIVGSDSIVNVDLGNAQIYPISAMLQWHVLERGAIRPYLGAGAVYTILRNIEKQIPSSNATGIEFKDPIGLAIGGGLEWSFSKQWGIYGDARYVPIGTKSRANFLNTTSVTQFNTRPLIISTGIAYRLRR
jgi:outer membrane protein